MKNLGYHCDLRLHHTAVESAGDTSPWSRPLSQKPKVSEVHAKGGATNSNATDHDPEHGDWHTVGVPCPAIQRVHNVIHRGSESFGFEDGIQSKAQKEHTC